MAKYCRLSYAERKRIEQLKSQGKGVRAIASALMRSPSTISDEVRRRSTSYKADTAQKDVVLRQKMRGRKRKITGPLEAMLILYLTELRCSPEQICGHLRKRFPKSPEYHISPEAIYLWVYAHPTRQTLTLFLRRRRRYRKARGEKQIRRGGIKNRVSIKERPCYIEAREEVGHWEGDLIIGQKNQSSVGTLIERSSRYTVLIQLDNKEAGTVEQKFIRFLKQFPPHLRKSLTYDNGSEMAYHEKISSALNMPIYFADPHSPWQRGTNENTNGLIREFLPKGTDLSVHSQEYLGGLAALLNRRPRKVLEFNSPEDVFAFCCEIPDASLSKCLADLAEQILFMSRQTG